MLVRINDSHAAYFKELMENTRQSVGYHTTTTLSECGWRRFVDGLMQGLKVRTESTTTSKSK
ncbi:hypothetical protein SAMN04488518_1245 [Pseudovibrio ascidiaceicola]|uniref:Uncharacterized protein n=1 Tax=Pseudovibrio ascidiaceicola TaxID=285279 RepID=A0A1I4G0J1_9HYPH|nr:hypothetical protein SAMN04488518_1245 [Pseudovibrio ascidiaceicola]